MRGVENIIKMRRVGVKPSVVYVETRPMGKWARRFTDTPGDWVDLHLDAKDVAACELIDLRCLVGIDNVIVSGINERDVERLGQAVIKAGAKVATLMIYDDKADPFTPKALVKSKRITKESA